MMSVLSGELVVPARFNGPPGVANGGWISGLMASYLPSSRAVEVTLRAPTPLGVPLRVAREAAGARLMDGDRLLVEAVEAEREPSPAPFVPAATAKDAERNFPGAVFHPFPGCFVCGDREVGEGLRIHPGPTGLPGVFAALWHVRPELADWSAALPLTHVWGALDCPTAWVHLRPGLVALLGRMTARVHGTVTGGTTCIVTARAEAVDGRKHHSSSAIYTEDGTLLAAARATWITVTS